MNSKYSVFLKIVCILICLHSYSTDGQTTDILFYEDFTDESNNATTGTDDYNIDWQIDLNGANPREFKVKNDEFKSKDTRSGIPHWYTDEIDVSSHENFIIRADIKTKKLENSDYIKFFYKKNGSGELILIDEFFDDLDGDQYMPFTVDAETTSIQIYVEFRSNDAKEEHKLKDIRLTGELVTCSNPTTYTVSGNDLAYCSGNTQTTTIGLSDSDVGVDYQLLKDGVNEGASIAGTGSALSYGAFSDNGTYTIEATNSEGCTQTMTGNVVITVTNVTSAFSITPTSVVLGNSVQFNNLSSNATSYAWDFGDSFGTSLFASPSYTYNATGTYTVTLVATGANGCNATSTQNITVTPAPDELFYEDFSTEANGATSGTDLYGTTWGSDDTNVDDDIFVGVYDDSEYPIGTVFWVGNEDEDDGTDGDYVWWYTDNIDIQDYENFNLSMWVEFYEIEDETDDYIKFYYKLDNGDLVLIDTIRGDFDDDGDYEDWDLDITGNTLQIWVQFSHDSDDEWHGIGNVKLTGTTNYNFWSGSENDVISNTSKWSKGTVPTSSSDVLIPSSKHLKLISDHTFNAVKVRSGAELTVAYNGSLIVNDFTNNGTMRLNSDAEEFSSLVVNGTASGDVIYNRWTNNFEGVTASGNDVIGSPVVGESWQSVKTNNESVIYNNGTLYSFTPYLSGFYGWSDYYTSTTQTTITSGRGYRVATFQGSSAPVKFTGTVQTGTVNVTLRRVNNPWNVVANPYTSYISLSDFLSANAAVLDDSKVYVLAYNGLENNSYWTYYNTNDAAGVYIAPGQGFYVAAKSDNATLTFTPSMRTIQGDDDFIDGRSVSVQNTVYKFKLNINSGDNNRHTKFYFRDTEAVSEDFDRAYDGVLKEDGDNFKLYSKLITNSETEKLAFQTAPISSLSESSIAIGVNMTSGQQFTFSLKDVDIPQETLVYLEDRDKDTWTLLNDGNSYVINTSETISGSGRFFLHFEPNDALSNKDIDLNEVGIKAIHNTKQIIISGQLAEDTNVTIYDINGKTILKTTIDAFNTTNRIDVKNLITGIYLVQLNNNSQTVSKQILVK